MPSPFKKKKKTDEKLEYTSKLRDKTMGRAYEKGYSLSRMKNSRGTRSRRVFQTHI